MLISVNTILNYGLGVGMALLAGIPALFAVYRPVNVPSKAKSATRLLMWSTIVLVAYYTTNQYAKYRSIYEQVPGIAPLILYMGLLPIWYQLALVG